MRTKEWHIRRPRHLLAKLICLFVAVLFWLYVMRVAAPPYDVSYTDIPVTVVDAEGAPYTGEADMLPSVRVLGAKEIHAVTTPESIFATVLLSELTEEDRPAPGKTVTMTVHFSMPEGLTVDGEYRVSVLLKEKT